LCLGIYAQTPSMTPTSVLTPQTQSASEEQLRIARALYFNDFSGPGQSKLEDQDPTAPPSLITHYPAPKSELPADLSHVIVLGTISNSQAFQSQDHRSVTGSGDELQVQGRYVFFLSYLPALQ